MQVNRQLLSSYASKSVLTEVDRQRTSSYGNEWQTLENSKEDKQNLVFIVPGRVVSRSKSPSLTLSLFLYQVRVSVSEFDVQKQIHAGVEAH